MRVIIKEVLIFALIFIVIAFSSFYLIFLIDSSKNDDNGIVSITFDDGYRNVYDFAFPLMEYYDYSGTVYYIVRLPKAYVT